MNNKKIVICVPTYMRPIYLEKNLQSIINQNFNYNYEIAVVDNDPKRSAEHVVNQFKKSKIECNYFVENKRGISAVRNKCIEICKKKEATYLIFIDDDEIAEKTWLKNLINTAKEYEAEVVEGPHLCKFEGTPHDAIKKVYFNRKRSETGTVPKFSATSNVLINMNIFKKIPGLLFDENFALMGGGDTHFFMEVKSHGTSIVWCDQAIVYEFISKERSQLKNCLLRSFYQGNSLFYIFKNTEKEKLTLKIVSFKKNFINILILIIRLLFYLITLNYTKIVKTLDNSLNKIGFLFSFITGFKSKKYKNIFGE
jgi:GT2 family glycosyltransferase